MAINNYRSYIIATDNIIQEIKDDMSADDRKFIKKKIKDIGKLAYWKWFNKESDMVNAYAKAAPSRRRNTKSWNEPQTKPMLMLAAIHLLESSKNMMIATEFLIKTDERSNRGIAALFGNTYFLIKQDETRHYML